MTQQNRLSNLIEKLHNYRMFRLAAVIIGMLLTMMLVSGCETTYTLHGEILDSETHDRLDSTVVTLWDDSLNYIIFDDTGNGWYRFDWNNRKIYDPNLIATAPGYKADTVAADGGFGGVEKVNLYLSRD